jgi:Uma2 family endonuclease
MPTKAQIAPEQRLSRIPDFLLFERQLLKPDVPPEPPLLVIEMLSRDGRCLGVVDKIEELARLGIPDFGIVDPLARKFSHYAEPGRQNLASLPFGEYPPELTQSVLLSDL